MLNNHKNGISYALNVISILFIAGMYFGILRAHVDDTEQHNTYSNLSEKFVPRSELVQVINNLETQINRLENVVDRLEADRLYSESE